MIHFRQLLCSLIILVLSPTMYVLGQGVAVNQTGAVADASAMLDISAAQKGLLIPRLTTIERNNITQPAKALLIFNTTTSRFEVNTGTAQTPAWEALVTLETLPAPNGAWSLNGNNVSTEIGKMGSNNAKSIGLFSNNVLRIYIDSTSGWVGINTQIPKSALHIATTDAVVLPVGNTAQRPAAPVVGMIRFNTETGKLEGFTADGWKSLQ